MKSFIAAIIVAPLLLAGTLTAAGGQTVSSGTQTQPATEQDTYRLKAQDDMQAWGQKLHAFGEKAKAKGQQAGDATADDLNAAWSKTQVAAQKLRVASVDGWYDAKASYERASHDLADSWNRIRPEDK
jgi:hypothetical protein